MREILTVLAYCLRSNLRIGIVCCNVVIRFYTFRKYFYRPPINLKDTVYVTTPSLWDSGRVSKIKKYVIQNYISYMTFIVFYYPVTSRTSKCITVCQEKFLFYFQTLIASLKTSRWYHNCCKILSLKTL